MASIRANVWPKLAKAPSTFGDSALNFIPGICKRQIHQSSPLSYVYRGTIDNKDTISVRLEQQHKMDRQLVKDMWDVLKHTTMAPIPGEMSDMAFDMVFRSGHLTTKLKFAHRDAAAELKMAETMARMHNDVELAHLKLKYGMLGAVGLGLCLSIGTGLCLSLGTGTAVQQTVADGRKEEGS